MIPNKHKRNICTEVCQQVLLINQTRQ